ncbi:unnamed protein product [Lupinus luteus]|uniref:Knottins-like domain-containing protein n=1 Tax=Lupinus luteus TaxID=3873 RepID=A0AAV1W796_LUPLU
MARKSLGFFFLLLIVFAAQMMTQTEARTRVCESQSHMFKGPCSRDHNCALVCRNEAFSGGKCKGFRRRCFCTKLCVIVMANARFGIFFMLLIVLSSHMMVQSEGRHCESKSHRFKGKCFSNHNCASVCHVEGFTGGKCRGFRQRCFCTKVC